ncbi:GntR family transcriptional regulator [Burkholderia sp. LFS038]|uniref:GntR family transcriptional regulator n=1 Tax=Burkholderia sp. LFS038 TaxID=3229884 RepID=UPI003A81196F
MTPKPFSTPGLSNVLETSSLRVQAGRILRARIVTGQLVPGWLYAIRPVASEFGVSVTPIREALLDLASDGLVRIVRKPRAD